MLASLRTSVPVTMLQSHADLKGEEEFDLLIIGGGATGSGVAVDAASRGLKVALVDRGDFSSGGLPTTSGFPTQRSDTDPPLQLCADGQVLRPSPLSSYTAG